MENLDFASISFLGVVASLLIQWVKGKWGYDEFKSRTAVVVLALFIGTSYYAIRDTSWYQTVLGVLAASQVVFGFLIAKRPSEK